MLRMDWKMMMDVLCGRRRRVRMSVWFLLLFTAGGLIHFLHYQDLVVIFKQPLAAFGNSSTTGKNTTSKTPGNPDNANTSTTVGSTTRLSRETLLRSEKSGNDQAAQSTVTGQVTPMQSPHFEETTQPATSESREPDTTPQPVSTKQRKLLRTSNANNVSSPSTATASELEKWKKITNTLKARKNLVKEMCAKYRGNISRTITGHHVRNLYVSDKYKLLYCQIPKAGCSNWKRTLIVLNGKATKTDNLQHDAVHAGVLVRTLNSYDLEGIMHRLKTYTKVMFTREPMERMVSAYRDKIENVNPYYHSVYGKPIIAKYRPNASAEALKTGDGVTFKEFVKYVTDPHRPIGIDIHWNEENIICETCLLNYDFIGKFETMVEESNFLLRLIGAPHDLKLPTFKDRNPSDAKTSFQITESYYSQVTPEEKQRVYDFYHIDYQMFNYSKPFKDLH